MTKKYKYKYRVEETSQDTRQLLKVLLNLMKMK
jgi:hypothetical protein